MTDRRGSADLFEHAAERDMVGAPLAERMRPRDLAEVVGQEHLLGEGKMLSRVIAQDALPSLLMWGPPGSGKTTLARIIAVRTGAHFVPFSAVLGGVKEVRQVIEEARERLGRERRRTILFVDEIHRFNKAQQDAFLPHVERGVITLIGATTENPSFYVNAALASRCQVVRLVDLSPQAIEAIVQRALSDVERGLGGLGLTIDTTAIGALAERSGGDARRALTTLEIAARLAQARGLASIGSQDVEQALQRPHLRYDKDGEEHYDVVSAFIKSMRGSDPDAAVYWMARMLEAGEDPLFVSRRMLILASEDVGNADPRALQVAVAADEALRRLGMPEAIFALTQAATYLAVAPKSNSALRAYGAAREDLERSGALPVPMRLRNAPTRLMRSFGYGEGYRYPHDAPGGVVAESYLPDQLAGRTYYEPADRGLEGQIKRRLDELRAATAAAKKQG